MLLNSASPESAEYIKIMLKECERLNNLIGDILFFSKPRAVNMKKFDLKDFFNGLIKEFSAGIKGKINFYVRKILT